MRRTRTIVVWIAAAAALSACGGTSVGNQSLFNYTPKPPGNFGFQGTPSPGRAALGAVGAGPTSAPRQSAAPPPAAAAKFSIAIYGDTSATTGFDPKSANIVLGTIVVFVNKDSQARSVVSDSGPAPFSSPLIPPGGSWQWTASKAGSYSYHDGTRPYTIASFSVVAH